MVDVSWFDYTTGVVSIFTAFALYTSLYGKSNPLRSWAQASYIGFAMGINVTANVWYVYNNGYLPITRGDYIMIFALVLGAMTFLRLFPKYAYWSRLPIAIAVGANLGISLRTIIFANFLTQITSTIAPLFVAADWYKSLVNTTIAVSMLFMLSFFIYTVEIRGPLKWTAKLGEYAMYISFGVVFAQTFMGRLGLLAGFVQQLTFPDWKLPYALFFMTFALAVVLIMDRYGILEKYAD